MSSSRKHLAYIHRTGITEIDDILAPLTTFIQSYQATLDIGSAKISANNNALTITLYLFNKEEFAHHGTILKLNPIHIFIKEIEENQQSLASENNQTNLSLPIEPGYTPFTFHITRKNAKALKDAIEQQLIQGHPIPKKMYFLAKLEYEVNQDKWKDKAFAPGEQNKTPKTLQIMQKILANNALSEDQRFIQIADIISQSNTTSLSSLLFRNTEVKYFYHRLQTEILDIQNTELVLPPHGSSAAKF